MSLSSRTIHSNTKSSLLGLQETSRKRRWKYFSPPPTTLRYNHFPSTFALYLRSSSNSLKFHISLPCKRTAFILTEKKISLYSNQIQFYGKRHRSRINILDVKLHLYLYNLSYSFGPRSVQQRKPPSSNEQNKIQKQKQYHGWITSRFFDKKYEKC